MDPGSFVEGGQTLTTFFFLLFLVDEGREVPYTTIAGHHLTASETPTTASERPLVFRWRADDGPTLNAGLVGL